MPELQFRILPLADGRYLAQPKLGGRLLLLTPRPGTGSFRLSGGGALSLSNGKVLAVSKPATTRGYTLVAMADGSVRVARVNDSSWAFTIRSSRAISSFGSSGRFAILDLQSKDLLLARQDGVSQLAVGPAPDGIYPITGGTTILVRGGQVSSSSGQPIYQYADDFAP
jgi:hypothetical protein